MNRIPGKKWDGVTQAMLNCIKVKNLGPESTFKGQVGIWVEEYLSREAIYEDIQEYIEEEATGPFLYAGRTHFRLDPFVEWLALRKSSKETRKKITAALRENGICPMNRKIKFKTENTYAYIRAWRVNNKEKKIQKSRKVGTRRQANVIDLKAKKQIDAIWATSPYTQIQEKSCNHKKTYPSLLD